MRVGKIKRANSECIRRSEASLNHAVRDVDLLLELSPDFNAEKYRDVVILLKGSVSPSVLDVCRELERE